MTPTIEAKAISGPLLADPICTTETDDFRLVRYDVVCKKWEDELRKYISTNLTDKPEDTRTSNIQRIGSQLTLLNEAVGKGDLGRARFYAGTSSGYLQGLYSSDAAEAEIDVGMYEDMLFGLKVTGITVLGVGLVGKLGVVGGLKLLSYTYGGLSIFNVLYHAGDEPGSKVASLPGEEIFGSESRPFLGIAGNASIAYLLGYRLFGLNPWVTAAFVVGNITSEYIIQHNSNDVSFANLDWTRTWGGATSALLTFGPMNWLWNGIGPWVGWGVLASHMPVRAIAGFIFSSAAVNSALFIPIAQWLERGNLWNFWAGLTLRELTLSVPRKVLLAVLNPNSVPGILINTGLKIGENYVISKYFSLFAGSGLYRASLHEFLSKAHSAEEFAAHSFKALSSLRLKPGKTHDLEEDDFARITCDIINKEFSFAELTKIAAYVDEILSSCDTDRDRRDLGLAWLTVFIASGLYYYDEGIRTVVDKHAHVLNIRDGLDLPGQIETLNE